LKEKIQRKKKLREDIDSKPIPKQEDIQDIDGVEVVVKEDNNGLTVDNKIKTDKHWM
jgi:hypothetical protein